MNRQTGFTLIEVLVALIVLSVGLLGVAALQANALKTNHSALQRSQAVMLAYFMLDAMRANRQAALNGDYDLGSTANPVCTSPSGSTLVTHDQAAWINALKQNLGNVSTTCGMIDCDNTGDCTVQIQWDDSRAGGLSTQMIEVRSRL
ncbi:type IV pilus modification protein PilV [Caldichromatium japonicum]|uniref:Type IV pilus modification protein PilV n=1 Tax=Caldichromatium japonicum TaxID=2699430 RepID=A0A6G7V9S7_9GAMM|nr:type IV pilus modification protein PilV [Caldichromatium japonicum]QIK36823.1 type IV pilus modification protein PilV [Caldichromatium japonicum]